MNEEIKEKLTRHLNTYIKPFIDKNFEIHSFETNHYYWNNEMVLEYNLINNTKNEESIAHNYNRISLSVKYDDDIIRDAMCDIITEYFKDTDFIILKHISRAEIINVKYVKPTISGKYKTNLRITKPVKGVQSYENGYYFDRFNVSYAIGGLKTFIDKNNGTANPKTTNTKHQKIVDDIIAKTHEAIENYNNINLGDIIKFHIYSNRNCLCVENIRGEDGAGISLDMLPDNKIVLKKAVLCLDSDDYIITDNNICVNFKKIFSDEYNIKVMSNMHSSSKYIIAEHIKNNIDANHVYLYESDFNKMLEKPNLDPDLEEKIITHKLLLMI